MPEEFSRTTKNKKVLLPGSSANVLVPVITQISFIDPINQYQEYQYTVDNSAQGDRDVHVDQVKGALNVERIDVWRYIDPVQKYQEKAVTFDNKTMGDSPPPYFTTHEKTRVVRYVNTPDNGAFIDSELIDEFKVVDPIRQYQEYYYRLNNPPGDDDGLGHLIVKANPDDPDITDAGNGVDPPWRTDPFQNIVNFGAPPTGTHQEYFIWVYPPLGNPPPRWVSAPTETGGTGTEEQQQRAWIQDRINAGEAPDLGIFGAGKFCGDRLLRSTLINDAAMGSNIGSDNPASIYYNVTIAGFGSTWVDVLNGYDSIFVTPEPPNHLGAHGQYLYYWCTGSYVTNDQT